MGTFSRIDWGSTRIDATSGDWTRSVSDLELGTLEYATFVSPSPMFGGDIELGRPRPPSRRFAFWVDSVFDGSATSVAGAHWDEMQYLTDLFNPGSTSEVELKTQRPDTSNSTISRSIWVRCLSVTPFGFTRDAGTSGVWVHTNRGRIRYRVDCYARYPFWRDTSATATNLTGTATITTTGDVSMGVKISFSAVTSVTSLALSNAANGFAVTFTSPTTSSIADFLYTDPTAMSTTAATINALAYMRLNPGANDITSVLSGTSYTSVWTYRNEWHTP